jgi:GMP synthase (glutamine-hydrolysing) A subunit
MASESTLQPTVLVVDFGAQYAQLIARRVREAQVYSEIVPHRITAKEVLARKPIGIILSGGPASVHVEGAPLLDPEIYELGIPILGICYGCQLIAQQLGGEVARGGRGEYGRTALQRIEGSASQLHHDAIPAQLSVWMSHFDAVSVLPSGFVATASTPGAPMAIIESPARKIWGVQYHPEVGHTEHGQDVLEQFLHQLVGAERSWTMSSIVDDQVAAIRELVGKERVICGLSGGVDSAVAALPATAGLATTSFVNSAVTGLASTAFVNSAVSAAAFSLNVEADDSTLRAVTSGSTVRFTGSGGITTTSDSSGNITIIGGGTTGNVTFAVTTIDSSDSSAIRFTPAVIFDSDVTVQNNLVIDNSVDVALNLSVNNQLTVKDIILTGNFSSQGSGIPELFSDGEIRLTAGTRVLLTSSPLKMASFTSAARDLLIAVNGDVIYNTTTNKFQGRANSVWVDLH